jgi:hypothetical protein
MRHGRLLKPKDISYLQGLAGQKDLRKENDLKEHILELY